MKRAFLVWGLIAVAVVVLLFLRPSTKPETVSVAVSASVKKATGGTASVPSNPRADGTEPVPPSAAAPDHEHIDLADGLNDPKGTIGQDLQILRTVFDTWITNFPRDGNPVGENSEITAALMGKNRLNLVLIEPNHRAINARGELVDRWGTPFRLHQLSGTRMELQSAGPDRKFATADDVTSTP